MGSLNETTKEVFDDAVVLPSEGLNAPDIVGAVVSIVTDRPVEEAEFAALSVALATTEYVPEVREISMVQFPDPSAVPVPREVAPLNNSMDALGSDVPVKVKLLVFLVMLSELLDPVSSAEARFGTEGAVTDVITVMASADEEPEVFPAASLAFAVRECTPAANETSTVHAPPALVVVVAMEEAPSNSSTELRASAVPEIVRFVV
jgi:hypothetical protein